MVSRGLMLVALAATTAVSTSGCSEGCHPLPVSSTSTDPAGARFYYYANDAETIIPPPHFDPLSASAAELRRYGFPPRPPAGSAARSSWNRAMSHAETGVEPGISTCPDESG